MSQSEVFSLKNLKPTRLNEERPSSRSESEASWGQPKIVKLEGHRLSNDRECVSDGQSSCASGSKPPSWVNTIQAHKTQPVTKGEAGKIGLFQKYAERHSVSFDRTHSSGPRVSTGEARS